MKRLAVMLIGFGLVAFAVGPVVATDSTVLGGYARKDGLTQQLRDSEHPNHVLVFPGLQTVTLSGHGTANVTAVSTAVATSSNTLYGTSGVVFNVPVTETLTAIGTGSCTGTGTHTSTGTATGTTTASYSGSETATASYTTPMTGTITGTITVTKTLTGTVTGTVETTGTLTITTTGTASMVGLGTGAISGTATRTATASGTGTVTTTATATGTATWTVHDTTNTKVDTQYLTVTENVTATANITGTVTATNTETASASSTGTGTWTHTGTTTATQTATSAPVDGNPVISGALLIPWAATGTGTANVITGADGRLSNARPWTGGPGTKNYLLKWTNTNTSTATSTSTAVGDSLFSDNGTQGICHGDFYAPGAIEAGGALYAANISGTPGVTTIPVSNASGNLNDWVTHASGDLAANAVSCSNKTKINATNGQITSCSDATAGDVGALPSNTGHVVATHFGNNTQDRSASAGTCTTVASVNVTSTSTASLFLVHGVINGDSDYSGATLICKMAITYDSNVNIPGGYAKAESTNTLPYTLAANTQVTLGAGSHTIYMALCNLDSGGNHCQSNAATSVYNAGTLLVEQWGY
jgi:hypothetical protein